MIVQVAGVCLMNFSALFSTVFVTACLATDSPGLNVPKSDAFIGEVDSLQKIILKQHLAVHPPFLVTTERWEKEVAKAFTVGQVLGKCCDENDAATSSNSSSSQGMKRNYVKLNFELDREEGNVATLKVDMNSLQLVISANLEWNDFDHQTYNPFNELFDLEKIQNPENYDNEAHIHLYEFRDIFANHARTEAAMIAVDVAILRWLAYGIKAKPQASPYLVVSRDILLGICSLSFHPTIKGLCSDDILSVLTHFQQQYPDPTNSSCVELEYDRAPLITLFKFLEDGPIRVKVMEILTKVCSNGRHDFVSSKMILGADHPFLKILEKRFSTSELASNELKLQSQKQYERTIYSMITSSKCDNTGECYISFPFEAYISAQINPDDTLNWVRTVSFEHPKLINFITKFISDVH